MRKVDGLEVEGIGFKPQTLKQAKSFSALCLFPFGRGWGRTLALLFIFTIISQTSFAQKRVKI